MTPTPPGPARGTTAPPSAYPKAAPGKWLFGNVRWWVIAPLLVASTMLNHLNRNVLSQAAPVLKMKLGIDEAALSYVLLSFQSAYIIMHLGAGRIIDRLGTRIGFAASVAFWSVANICHSFATGWRSMAVLRWFLGAGEGGNYPAAAKAIAEWYPPRERSVATGVLNIGTGFGAMAAPVLTTALVAYAWQAPFVVTGLIGFIWVWLWMRYYRKPEEHPWVDQRELIAIRTGAEIVSEKPDASSQGVWRTVLSSRNMWGVSIARFFTEQPWAFCIYWLPTYLNTQRHLDMKGLAIYGWVPFLAADLGCIFGGYLSPTFNRLGFRLLTARKLAITIPCVAMIVVLLAYQAPTVEWAIFYFCIATFSHQALCASLLALPTDLMPKHTVATSLGLTGALGFSGVMLSTAAIGQLAKHGIYAPIFYALAFMDLGAAAILWILVREPSQNPTSTSR